MAIKATSVYRKHGKLYDTRARHLVDATGDPFTMPNLKISQRPEQSMAINRISSGAIIIAGSGMCTGGRIVHHLKYNAWRNQAHIVMVGFQAAGTRGRALVDGAETIHLWGESIRVNAKVHTVGGLSAHADQEGLVHWYRQFEGRPPVALIHGEPDAMQALATRLQTELHSKVTQPDFAQRLAL
jgi:metallo-beta-lactamase family protein